MIPRIVPRFANSPAGSRLPGLASGSVGSERCPPGIQQCHRSFLSSPLAELLHGTESFLYGKNASDLPAN